MRRHLSIGRRSLQMRAPAGFGALKDHALSYWFATHAGNNQPTKVLAGDYNLTGNFSPWCQISKIPSALTSLPPESLFEFKSIRATSAWQTTVTITNVGQGLVSCPAAMQTSIIVQCERFAVPGRELRTFVWHTTAPVANVVIDPKLTGWRMWWREHRLRCSFQHSRECRSNRCPRYSEANK